MTNLREIINVVWLKRDLRLQDNEAISKAIQTHRPLLLLYIFEPLLLSDKHYSQRHFNFIKESVLDLNRQLLPYKTKILCVDGSVIATFSKLQEFYIIETVFSHIETGLLITYNRDKDFKHYCKTHQINWIETKNNGVVRGLINRDQWFENWESYMHSNQEVFKPNTSQLLNINTIENLEKNFSTSNLETPTTNTLFQKGGATMGWKYANSFLEKRYQNYMFHISKPHASRTSCSRLSPYIAWGNISIRQIFNNAYSQKSLSQHKRHLGAFLSRLRWQAHFIQKFEMEHTMEKESVNKGYHKLKKQISKRYQDAWKTGQTGFPLVDASMRCLIQTGYVNFRMRAMLVSFFTHILWQPWQDASKHLSQQFLDFEPGIHFPQIQMQAGETGINNLRIYNPTVNGLNHDSEAVFIKTWVPELKHLDIPFVHQPYLMTPLEQGFYNFKLGRDYTFPIVDIKANRKKATDVLWSMKKNPDVMRESKRILLRHTIADRNRMLRSD